MHGVVWPGDEKTGGTETVKRSRPIVKGAAPVRVITMFRPLRFGSQQFRFIHSVNRKSYERRRFGLALHLVAI
jgi:hypothetical protein